MSLKHINASNGSGEAVTANVTDLRTPGSTTLIVDSVTNWPAFFIATSGAELSDDTLDPSTVLVFLGHVSGSTIVIDTIAPGYTDTRGSLVNDIVVIKPTTVLMDMIASLFGVSHNDDGTLKNGAVEATTVITDGIIINSKLSTAAGELGGAWTNWASPTFSNFTLGNGTVDAAYRIIGKGLEFRLKVTLGSTSSVGTNPAVAFPVTPKATYQVTGLAAPFGQFIAYDVSLGNRYYGVCAVDPTGGSNIQMLVYTSAGGVIGIAGLSATSPATSWNTGDIFWLTGSLELA